MSIKRYEPVETDISWEERKDGNWVSYGDYAQARREALSEAAKACDEIEAMYWDAYKRGNGPERADPHYQGMSDGAGECAVHIRALAADHAGKEG